MSHQASQIRTTFKVVNHEEQYSIRPCDRPNASGWRDARFQGRRTDYLVHVEAVWKDMQPLSLRRMDGGG